MAQKSVGNKQHFEVNDDLIAKLDKGDIKFSDLDEATNAAVGVYLDKMDETAPDEVPAAQTPATETVVTQDEPVKPPKGFVEGSRFKEKADEASDYKNKWLADQRRLRELEEKLKTKDLPPIEKPSLETVWSDGAQVDLHQGFAELKRKVEAWEADQTKTLTEIKAEKLAAMNETELVMLRSNPLFRDSIPAGKTMEKMEEEYSAFYFATGATAEDATNVKKYFSDASFRKEMESKGVKPPEDFEKINTVLQVKAIRDKFRSADPEFKMSDAYVHFMAKNDKLSAVLTGERLKGAAQVADKLHGIANETITMQPGLTSGATQNDWSDAQIGKWLDEHKHPKTKDEVATYNRICAILDEREKAANTY